MTFCELCWIVFVDLPQTHNASSVHLRGSRVQCNDCCRWFSSRMARSRHRSSAGCSDPPISQFHCCECDKDFSTQGALNQHLNNETIHPPRVVISLSPSAGYCESCDKKFPSVKALEQHRASVIHNPIMHNMTCLGGKGCNKKFHTPSGMLSHLESGACASKITQNMIDDLVIAHDSTNLITNQVAVQQRAYSSSVDRSTMFTPGGASSNGSSTPDYFSYSDSRADYDEFLNSSSSSWGSLRRPGYSSNPSSRAYPTPSDSGNGIFPPTSAAGISSQLVVNKFTCPLCPKSTKQYKNLGALHDHMQSQIHTAKIYHCPPASLFLGSGHESTGNHQKGFETLSGLSQHVEAGACDGGKATFNTAMSFVNDRLRGMGLGNLKLVEQ